VEEARADSDEAVLCVRGDCGRISDRESVVVVDFMSLAAEGDSTTGLGCGERR
jgi:hypothetical protein